jgi:hypothetical protein
VLLGRAHCLPVSQLACLERCTVLRQPKLDTKHAGRRLYAVEIVHRRQGIAQGGGGPLYAEDLDQCSEWYQLLRRHSGHHDIQNVFRFNGDGERSPTRRVLCALTPRTWTPPA